MAGLMHDSIKSYASVCARVHMCARNTYNVAVAPAFSRVLFLVVFLSDARRRIIAIFSKNASVFTEDIIPRLKRTPPPRISTMLVLR